MAKWVAVRSERLPHLRVRSARESSAHSPFIITEISLTHGGAGDVGARQGGAIKFLLFRFQNRFALRLISATKSYLGNFLKNP